MHPLSPSHQALFAAYETYLRQKTLVDASRKRLLRLARRYLHYLDTEYPGIEATRISYPQCCAFLQTLEHLKVNTYNLYLVDLRGFLQFWKAAWGESHLTPTTAQDGRNQPATRFATRSDAATVHAESNGSSRAGNQSACDAQPGHHRVAVFYRYACLRTVAAARRGFFPGPWPLCRGYGQARCGSHHLARQACCCRPCDAISWRGGLHPKKGRSCLAVSRQKGQPLKYGALRNVIRKISQDRIGCPVTPHTIRHTFATQC